MILHLIFYGFSFVALASAIMVISTRNPVKSVLSLVVTFFAMAGIWMLLQAEFLALILVLVYVGAVMTLFLFVVMMLSVKQESRRKGFVGYLPFAILTALLVTVLIIIGIRPEWVTFEHAVPAVLTVQESNIALLGNVLYTDYVYPFEIAGVLLLAAIIAAITLTHRGPVRRKVQNIGQQAETRKEDRVRLVNMPVEKK